MVGFECPTPSSRSRRRPAAAASASSACLARTRCASRRRCSIATNRSTPRHATFARIVERRTRTTAQPIDQVVVTWFAAPHSYTGEDVVEISGHGSPLLLRRIVELAIAAGAQAGRAGRVHAARVPVRAARSGAGRSGGRSRRCRDAAPGARGDGSARGHAHDHHRPDRRRRSSIWARGSRRRSIFPTKGFHFVTREEALDECLADSGRPRSTRRRRPRRAAWSAKAGWSSSSGGPTPGKSSLFNALVGAARAIVTEIPGTTRDLLTERVDIDGLPVTLVDTAGIRDARDAIEAEGVSRARQAREVAALSVVVVDGSTATVGRGPAARSQNRRPPRLIVVSKADLPRQWEPAELGRGATQIVRGVRADWRRTRPPPRRHRGGARRPRGVARYARDLERAPPRARRSRARPRLTRRGRAHGRRDRRAGPHRSHLRPPRARRDHGPAHD